MTRFRWTAIALVLCTPVLVVAPRAHALEVDSSTLGQSRDYLISGQIMRGWVVSFNENGFTFKIDARPPLDLVVENISWDAMPEVEANRIRQVASAQEAELAGTRGEVDATPATRYTLKNGRIMIGIPLPELSTATATFIQTKHARQFRIATADIKSEEPVMVPETQMYSLDELLRRKMSEINPTQGREFMELGTYLMRIGHFAGAKDAFERAMLLESRFEEPATKQLGLVKIALTDETAKTLAEQIVADKRAERYKEALQKINLLRSFAPDSHHLLQIEALIPEIERDMKRNIRRVVVNQFYQKLDELVRTHVLDRVVEGESIPGVVVSTKDGTAYKGILKNESDAFVEIETDGRTIKIERGMVVGIDQVNLNQNRRDPTFAESKEYVKDVSGGLGADILRHLAEAFKSDGLTPDDIKQYWADRLTDIVVVTRGGTDRTPPVNLIKEASYGTGTWLREGEQTAVAGAVAGARGRNRQNQIETDPERWWKTQPLEVRHQVLRATAAEAQCVVERVFRTPCTHCGGKGTLLELGVANDANEGARMKLCPSCRGTGKFANIRYK
jgi:hypothetical protein